MAESTAQAGENGGFPWKWIGLALLVIAVGVGRVYLPLGDWMARFNAWVNGLGPEGMVVFVVAYIIAAVLFMPCSVLTIGAGIIFGLLKGTILVSIGSTVGATCAFLVSRYVARDWVAEKASAHPRFGAVDRAVGREGGKIVGLLRLTPAIPYNLSNYLYGLTSVRLGPYVLASWLGMLPGTVMYVYLGTVTKVAAAEAAGATTRSWQENVMLGIGLVATIAVTIVVTRIARRALSETEVEGELET